MAADPDDDLEELSIRSGFSAFVLRVKTQLSLSSVKIQNALTQEHRNDVEAVKLS